MEHQWKAALKLREGSHCSQAIHALLLAQLVEFVFLFSASTSNMNQLIKSKYKWSGEHREYRQASNTKAGQLEKTYPAMTIMIHCLIYIVIPNHFQMQSNLCSPSNSTYHKKKLAPKCILVEINRLTMQIYTNYTEQKYNLK